MKLTVNKKATLIVDGKTDILTSVRIKDGNGKGILIPIKEESVDGR